MIRELQWMHQNTFLLFLRQIEDPQGTCKNLVTILNKYLLHISFLNVFKTQTKRLWASATYTRELRTSTNLLRHFRDFFEKAVHQIVTRSRCSLRHSQKLTRIQQRTKLNTGWIKLTVTKSLKVVWKCKLVVNGLRKKKVWLLTANMTCLHVKYRHFSVFSQTLLQIWLYSPALLMRMGYCDELSTSSSSCSSMTLHCRR